MSVPILITAKINPDLDGVACAYAYSHLLRAQGKNAVGGIFGQMHPEARYLIDRFNVQDVVYDPTGDFDKFVLVDASDMAGMPSVIRTEDVIEVIDHREEHRAHELFPNAKIQIEHVGSAATLIVEKYKSQGCNVDMPIAVLLFGAIYSNTLNFKSSIATSRDQDAIDWLRSQFEIPTSLVLDMFEAKTKLISENLTDAIKIDAKQFDIGKKKIGIAQLEVLNLQLLADSRLKEILVALENMKNEYQLDAAMLTAVDLEKGFNLFITQDIGLQSVIAAALNVNFVSNVAKKEGLLLRKQLVPGLRSPRL